MEWVVSHCDVEKHRLYDPLTPYEGNLDKILADYGLNLSKGYYIDDRFLNEIPEDWPKDEENFGYTHRSLFTNEVCTGRRYIGTARQDGKWKRFTSDFIEIGGLG